MSDSNSETTTTPKNVDTAASNSSNAPPGNATTVHRSPQKSRQNHNHNHNHNHNTNHGNHNSKNVNNSNIGGGGGGGGRKRRYTVGVAELHSRPGYPKRTRRKGDDDDPFEPPTVFKLGGNIHDPLNLNGIGANPGQTTPISSPFPSPFPLPADKSSSSRENASKEKVEVLIPPNICDPLNLSCPNALNESDLISPTNFKSSNRQRNNSNSNSNKRRRTSSETEVANEGANGKQQRSGSFHDSKLLFSRDDSFLGRRNTTGAAAGAAAMNRANREKLNAERKISPVAATTAAAAASSASSASSSGGQAGKSSNHGKSFSRSNSSSQGGGSTNANANRNQNRSRQQGGPSSATAPDPQSSTHTSSSSSEKPLPKNNKERFRFGNYNRYYGYRNSQHCDRRLELLPRDLIQGKDVLDVGCNIGHVTLTLARDYGPRRIVGVDIDPALIEVAKKNVRHYITEAVVQREGMPISMPLLYGPLANMPKQQGEDKETESGGGGFPNNVFFFALNYVPESDALLEVQEEEYDAIICLSLTKWIHLNWGDAGIRRLFLRAFRALRPGGCLILEPQPWSSYQKKAKLTPQIQSTYRSIRFRPDSFNEYLLKDVGFKSCELLGTPQNTSKGFQRPIYLYKKPAAPLKSATAAVSASTSASATEFPAPASSSSS